MVWPLKARGWQIVLALVVISLTGVAAGIYFTRVTGTDAVSLSAYFPEREATTFYLNVGAMRTSGILEKLVGTTVGEEEEYRRFVEGSGFDYKRDLNQVIVNSAGGLHYFVLEGRFEWSRLKAYAVQQGGKCEGDYCYAKGSTPDRIISFRKLRKNLMALSSGKDESGARAIERRTPEKPPYEVPGAPVWAHVPVAMVRSMPQYPAGTRLFAKALESAEQAVFTLTPATDGFQLSADVKCRSQEDAAVLKAQLESITALLQKFLRLENQNASGTDLSGILTAGSFERAGDRVKARWPISKAFIEALTRT